MNLKKILTLAAIPALALALTACGGKKSPAQSPAASASTASASAPSAPVSVDADSWAAEWSSDKTAFHKKYVDQKIRLSGEVERTVDGIALRVRSGILFKVKDKTKADLVQAFTDNDLIPVLKKMKAGDKVTVSCIAKENPLYPTCDNAVIEK